MEDTYEEILDLLRTKLEQNSTMLLWFYITTFASSSPESCQKQNTHLSDAAGDTILRGLLLNT